MEGERVRKSEQEKVKNELYRVEGELYFFLLLFNYLEMIASAPSFASYLNVNINIFLRGESSKNCWAFRCDGH